MSGFNHAANILEPFFYYFICAFTSFYFIFIQSMFKILSQINLFHSFSLVEMWLFALSSYMLMQSLLPSSPLVTCSSLPRTGQLSGSRNQTQVNAVPKLSGDKLQKSFISSSDKLRNFNASKINITWEKNSFSSLLYVQRWNLPVKWGNYLHTARLTHVNASHMLFFCHLEFLQLHFYSSSLQRPNKLMCLGLSRDHVAFNPC